MYLEEANHGLYTTDQAKVDTVLEWRHGYKEDSQQALPLSPDAWGIIVAHVDD